MFSCFQPPNLGNSIRWFHGRENYLLAKGKQIGLDDLIRSFIHTFYRLLELETRLAGFRFFTDLGSKTVDITGTAINSDISVC